MRPLVSLTGPHPGRPVMPGSRHPGSDKGGLGPKRLCCPFPAPQQDSCPGAGSGCRFELVALSD